ncbi:hypothetical protein IGI37_000638 [Enterococcus sp. AZ194]|uniref:hypothetical protein n=1 Tax=Enterococcus sp. AZ194 TaxID=2774629 RepID=UPI003F230387
MILDHANKSVPLIPIYSHRYLSTQYLIDNPVMSVYGCDVIYYGETLEKYLAIEFGNRQHKEIDYAVVNKVAFWGDL